jgi:hypothetical protein
LLAQLDLKIHHALLSSQPAAGFNFFSAGCCRQFRTAL